MPAEDATGVDEPIVRTSARKPRARPGRKSQAGQRAWGPWLFGLLGFAMVVALVSFVAVVLAVANRDERRSEPAPKKLAGKDQKASAPGVAPRSGKTEEKQGAKVGREIGDSFINAIGMELVHIPGGKFKMGSPESEVGRDDRDEQQHDVEVSSFHLGVHEVTQNLFRAVMGYNPSYFSTNARGIGGVSYERSLPGGGKDIIPNGDDTEVYPVENVSWEEAREFCEKLTSRDTKKPAGWRYRLPTEAEWEFACRGGSPTYQVFHFGNSLSSDQANFDGNSPYGLSDRGNYLVRTCKVGSYAKNRFGLYDMHGNVWEWCGDWYGQDYHREGPRKDPQGPLTGSERVYRGGSWFGNGRSCRSANRNRAAPMDRDYYIGFRVALVPAGR
jgi:formylglycine-generating enzyme required for sulfatase activity